MTTFSLRLAMVTAAALIPHIAWAQHDAHQQASPRAASAEMTQCLRVQRVIEHMITAATARAEAARLSNSPADLRAAVDHVDGVLRDVRAQLAPCATAAASTVPNAGHTMPGTQSPATNPPSQVPAGTAKPHAGHTMPSAAPVSKPTTTAKPRPAASSKPAASDHRTGHTMPGAAPASKGSAAAKPAPRTQSRPAASEPHAGHPASTAAPAAKPSPTTKPSTSRPDASTNRDPHAGRSAPSGDKQRDPVNGLMVDPASAPKTTYQGQMYYFSSEQSRKEFLESPAKFAKKPKG